MAALKYFFSLLMVPVSILAAGAGILAFTAAYLSPENSPLPAFSGLLMPLILLLNLLILLYWIFSRKVLAFIPAAALLLNFGYLLSIFQLSLFSPATKADQETVKIVTYNVGKFRSSGHRPTQQAIASYLQATRADIVCFQEYRDYPGLTADSLSRLLGLPYRFVQYLPGSEDRGSAIFSKYPFLSTGRLPFEVKENDAIWADIPIGDRTIRIVSCHLQTTNFNRKRREWNDSALTDKGIPEAKAALRDIGGELKENFRLRAVQANIVRRFADTSSYPIVICGDFNDTPASYTYHKIKGPLKDSFRSCGNGYAYTFRGLHRLLRIDYILYSPSLLCTAYRSPSFEWSDHNPVMTELIL